MEKLERNSFFQLAKQAKQNKNYKLERSYLEKALLLSPTNTKIINALIRNLRKEGDYLELKKWLEALYHLKPNGKILFELMELEQREGHTERVKEILIENVKIDPNSKKVKRRLHRVMEREKESVLETSIFLLKEKDVDFIKRARDIIYSENDFSSKYHQIVNLLAGQEEEVLIAVLAEFYKKESLDSSAHNLVKRYKIKLNPEVDFRKIKWINQLLQLVSTKKTQKYNWDDFWRNNTTILFDEKESQKVFVKSNFNNNSFLEHS